MFKSIFMVILAQTLSLVGEQTIAETHDAIVAKAKACLEKEAAIFATTYLDANLRFQVTSSELIFGTDAGGYVVFLKSQLKDSTQKCALEFDVMESALSLSINNLCGISTNFLNFYLANDQRLACSPPSIQLKLKTLNDGFDQYGQPVNERKVLESALTRKGDCVDGEKVFFRNLSTKRSTNLTLDIHSLKTCLQKATEP